MALPTVVGYIAFFLAPLPLWFVVDRAARTMVLPGKRHASVVKTQIDKEDGYHGRQFDN